MERQRYARQVMANPHPYRAESREKHPEPTDAWIERTLVDPYKVEAHDEYPGRTIYYKYIREAGRRGRWLLVIVQDDQEFNAYFDRDYVKLWGRPE